MSRFAEPAPSTAPTLATREPSGPTPARVRRGVVAWAIVGCVLMASSGIVRGLQDRRFEVEKGYLEACPFPLKSLPKEFDGWRLVDGGDKTLDSLTTRITGASEHVLRTYVDELTGVTLSVLILFGPAEPVLPHTPQICYPSCGYTATEPPSDRTIKGPDKQSYVFRAGVYEKSGGRAKLHEVAYHAFRLEGPWSPDVATGRKFPRKNPGIFKVQIQRRVAEGERRDSDDPIEQFLAKLIPVIDRRIAESQAGGPGSPPPIAAEAGSSDHAAPAGPGR